jgi:hypothetical protein
LPRTRKSTDTPPAKADTDRDVELDQVLRAIGDELLQQEVPERLRSVLRAATAAVDEASTKDQADPPLKPPEDGSIRTRGT